MCNVLCVEYVPTLNITRYVLHEHYTIEGTSITKPNNSTTATNERINKNQIAGAGERSKKNGEMLMRAMDTRTTTKSLALVAVAAKLV